MKSSPINPGKGLQRSSKPIKLIGRIGTARAVSKKDWEVNHPPLTEGWYQPYYYCWICVYFGESREKSRVAYRSWVLEHKEAKGHLTFAESQQDSNLNASHWECNKEKGSGYIWQMEKSVMSGLGNPCTSREEFDAYLEGLSPLKQSIIDASIYQLSSGTK